MGNVVHGSGQVRPSLPHPCFLNEGLVKVVRGCGLVGRAMVMVLAWACLAGLVPAGAVAQSNHASWSKIETGAWVMHPIYTLDQTGAASVSNFLALADPSAAVGDNLVAVWYQREPAGWAAKSWSTNDRWKAIKAVKEALSISDDEDDRWQVDTGVGSIAEPEEPKEYAAGVLADDPLAMLVLASPDRDSLVAFLATIGYKAADVPIEKDDGCTANAKLDGMAAAIVETITGEEETAVVRSMEAWIASGTAGCGIGSVAVAIVTFPPKPLTPWAPPVYACVHQFEWLVPNCWSTCQTWTETRTVVQRRTRARMNPAPPPTYQFCDQTNTGIETRTTECCVVGCITITTPGVVPCPVIPPGTTPGIGVGCPPGSTTTVRTKFTGAGWIPACPF